MAHIIIMPRQGNTVESCIITDWKVNEGDKVNVDTTVCEVETDKASFEVPAGSAGTVLKLLYSSGDDVPVLKPIAVIGAAGEDYAADLGKAGDSGNAADSGKAAPAPDVAAPAKTAAPAADKTAAPISAAPSASPASTTSPAAVASGASASPRARALAGSEGLPINAVAGSGPGGRIIERDVRAAMENNAPLTAAAKAAASGTGIAMQSGSGLGGRVTLEDLGSARAAGGAGNTAAGGRPIPSFSIEDSYTDTPIKGIRKIISDRMHASLSETAQFTLNASCPAQKLLDIRARIKAMPEYAESLGISRITINDLVLFATAQTLKKFPYMNAHKNGDMIRTFDRVHLAGAVDTPRGLMVPVIRNADLLSLTQISSEMKRLAAACINGTASPDELSGSTFTVSNLGGLGINNFTPVLNAPEIAILGVCNIEMKPVEVTDGSGICECCSNVRFENQIGFSLTINHQAVDGAPAARFLQALCDAIANIDLLITAL